MKTSSTGRSGIKRKKDPSMHPQLKRFPRRTLVDDRRQRFKAALCNIHPWLEYSQLSESVYCYACRHCSPANGTEAVFDPKNSSKNWKTATYRVGGFAMHAKSEQHKQAMITWGDQQRAVATDSTWAKVLKKKRNKRIRRNRDFMVKMGAMLRYSATLKSYERVADPHDIRFSGALLGLMAVMNEHMKKRLSSVNRAVYISKAIKNEVVDCWADMVRTKITEELKQSEVFSIMVDETMEHISLVLRYYFNGAVQESFLLFDFFEDASELSEKIIHVLESYGLEHRNNLVAQAHTGVCLNQSGPYSGVQAQIKEQAKYGFYIHSNAHCLNLVLVDAVNAVEKAGMFFDFFKQLYEFTSQWSVHSEWLDMQRQMYEGAPRELQHLFDTQEACRFVALQNIMDRLPALKRVLKEVSEDDDNILSFGARNLLKEMDLEFIVYLVTLCKVFRETKPLSVMLQSSAHDFSKVVYSAEALVHTLTDLRQESFFDNLWEEVLKIHEQCNTALLEPAERQENGLISEFDELSIVNTIDQREKFRTAFFYPVIDQMLAELNRRFSKTTCDIMNGIQALNPNSDAFLQSEVLFSLAQLYDSNIEHLGNELPLFSRYLERKIQAGMQRPSSTAELTLILEPLKDAFVELFRLCKIAVAIPLSAASSKDRGRYGRHGKVNIVKDHIRTTRTDKWQFKRMCNLDVLSIEHSKAEDLNLDSFVDLFAKKHKNRRIMLL